MATDREGARVLPLPKGDEMFHFVVFGDRTGGQPEGIEVLAQAVADTNLLDPDLVMTVGDLIQGYNRSEEWLAQMKEYRATMDGLRMPWFPVAGNHDIYWRAGDKGRGAVKPRDEHQDLYETHFGPLWYWFEHKRTGFLVLFSDEGHPDKRPRDFGDPEQQKIGPGQLEWLRGALAEMKPLDHIFVFLHHPFWRSRYPGSNWDEVHRLLAANGNVSAVLAGHIHQMTCDGKRDGIDYYSLATTGASLPGGMNHEYFGYIHHFNVVTVRRDGYSMAALPVGTVLDPRQFDGARQRDVHRLRRLEPVVATPPLEVNMDGTAQGAVGVVVENPSSLPIEVTVLESTEDPAWSVAPDHGHARIEPGEERSFRFACVRRATPSIEGHAPPEFEVKLDVLTPGLRITLPPREVQAETRLLKAPGG